MSGLNRARATVLNKLLEIDNDGDKKLDERIHGLVVPPPLIVPPCYTSRLADCLALLPRDKEDGRFIHLGEFVSRARRLRERRQVSIMHDIPFTAREVLKHIWAIREDY